MEKKLENEKDTGFMVRYGASYWSLAGDRGTLHKPYRIYSDAPYYTQSKLKMLQNFLRRFL